MLNGRFESLSGDPFDNSLGFKFPPPEGPTKFPPNDPVIRLLVAAQAHLPADRPRRDGGLHGHGGHHRARVRPVRRRRRDRRCRRRTRADSATSPSAPRWWRASTRAPRTVRRFGRRSRRRPLPPGGIDFHDDREALAEFQVSLTFADAPIDRFARGLARAMSSGPEAGRAAVLRPGALRRVPCGCAAHRTRCSAISGTT